MQRINVLLVEDDMTAAEIMTAYLEDCGFKVTALANAADALGHTYIKKFDIIILDLNLPDYNGLEFLKKLRQHTTVPVIVTSAHSDTQTKLTAFRYGANDYMTKPVDLEELEARIYLQLKNVTPFEDRIKANKPFAKEGGSITFFNEPLQLTPIEFEIFSLLLNHEKSTLAREEILESLTAQCSNRSLDNHIKNIRKKIGENAHNYLKTVYGVGYILNNH
jgi:DNA-binding response OmpR family regulator